MMRSYILIFCLSTLLIACGGKSLKIGDHVTVIKKCMATTSEAAYDEMNSASVRKDINQIQELTIDGKLFIIDEGKPGVVKDVSVGKCQVQFSMNGRPADLWIASEFVE